MTEDNDIHSTIQRIDSGVHELKTLLIGVEGVANSGFINQTNTTILKHGTRISSLEKYRWMVGGAVVLIVLLLELAVRAWK